MENNQNLEPPDEQPATGKPKGTQSSGCLIFILKFSAIMGGLIILVVIAFFVSCFL